MPCLQTQHGLASSADVVVARIDLVHGGKLAQTLNWVTLPSALPWIGKGRAEIEDTKVFGALVRRTSTRIVIRSDEREQNQHFKLSFPKR